jgi:site-specific recombinase XerD
MSVIERPYKSRKLPVVLAKEEVKAMIESTSNLKT